MEKSESQLNNFRRILNFIIVINFVRIFLFWLKSENNGNFTPNTTYIRVIDLYNILYVRYDLNTGK